MMIKKYLADSMPEAMKLINRELGKDAVILNQKEIFVGGFLGMFRKRKFEVIAARDPQPTQQQNVAQNAARDMLATVLQQAAGNGNLAALDAARKIGVNMPNAVPDPAQAALLNALQAAAPFVQQQQQPHQGLQQLQQMQQTGTIGQPMMPIAPVNVAAQMYSQAGRPPGQSPQAVATPVPSQVAVKESAKPHAVTEANPSDPGLMQEIRQMREMLKTMKQDRQMDEMPQVIKDLHLRLKEQELTDEIATQIIRNLIEQPDLQLKDETQARVVNEAVKQELIQLMGDMADDPVDLSKFRIVHFVGPTGVGKTTTLAKLAAEQVLKNKKKVGFITSDTYRISAVEQLKTYASILNVPIEVVNSVTDLPRAMKNLEDCELIFMDTAGRNFRNTLYVSELNNLLKQSKESMTFLVLSMTTKFNDMKAITANFSAFKIDRVLFTKIDETESYGSIINIIREFNLPPSYIANGQNVPNDIYPFDKHKIVELILGERSE